MMADEEWKNSARDDSAGGYDGDYSPYQRRDGYGGGRRGGGKRHEDTTVNLRVTVVADNGNLCVFHKPMSDGATKPVAIPSNRITTIDISQDDGKTLIKTSDGIVAVQESFEEAAEIYAASRPILVQD